MLISIIVTTYNRCEPIKQTLESLLSQKSDGSFDFEIILVDNNSTDKTKEAVQSYILKSKGQVKYFLEPKPGKSQALNSGVRQAKGDILAFTDDDVIVDSKWLLNMMRCFKEHGCDGVGGRVLPVYPEGTAQWIKDRAVQLSGSVVIYEYGDGVQKYEKTMYPFIGSNYAFKRKIFDEVGLFRTDLGPGTKTMGEDTEFVRRLAKLDKILFYCGKALVWHPLDLNRLKLGFVAKWNIALGKFDAHCEMNNNEKNFIYYFGIPRYLIKGVIKDFVSLFLNIFSKKYFYNAWRSFFRKVGMIEEYKSRRNVDIKENHHA